MSAGSYADEVTGVFRKRALRTAHIIDDEFPTYKDLTNEDTRNKFKQTDLAVALSEYLRGENILCDIDNSSTALMANINRIRKCDLIILDFNLGVHGPASSVALMRELSRSKHFNTVILYTAEANLDEVWRTVLFGLRGGWKTTEDKLRTDVEESYGKLGDNDVELPDPTADLMVHYAQGGKLRTFQAECDEYTSVFEQHQIPRDDWSMLIELAIHRAVKKQLKGDVASWEASHKPVTGKIDAVLTDPAKGGHDDPPVNQEDATLGDAQIVSVGEAAQAEDDDQDQEDHNPEPVSSGNADISRWIYCGNCFIAVVGKRDSQNRPTEPSSLIHSLDKALCEWQPGILQVLASEIQNKLELESVADELIFSDVETTVGVNFMLLSSLPHLSTGEGALAIHELLERLAESIKQSILNDSSLHLLAANLLHHQSHKFPAGYDGKDEMNKTQLEALRSAIFDAAESLANLPSGGEKVVRDKAILRLNSFLSTEPFRGTLTTGSVFRDGNKYWMCMTPVCDMVDRLPTNSQPWLRRVYPIKPIVALRLTLKGAEESLKAAEEGRLVFLNIDDSVQPMEVISKLGSAGYEFLFLAKGGATSKVQERYHFQATRMITVQEDHSNVSLGHQYRSYEVVGQVRANYANRILQQTGFWLSRIGVDYVRRVT